MSNGWSSRGRAPGPQPPLVVAQEARSRLQEQFYRVDQLQRDIGGTVGQYAAVLPDRAARTGLLPGFAVLNREADELILAYLALLDRFDPLDTQPLPVVQQSVPAFNDLTPRLGKLADDLALFLERFSPELQRVGEAKAAVQAEVGSATSAVVRAEAAWQAMRRRGYEFPAADEALARARIAGRKLAEIGDRLNAESVTEPVQVVRRLAAEAEQLATELPERVEALDRRIPSLATRIDAVRTRSLGVAEAMGALRREFAVPNWADLADQERDVERALSGAQTRVREIRRLHQAGDQVAALGQLALIETELSAAEALVDAPRQRLGRLREIRQAPHTLFEQPRFRLRDARYLIQRGNSPAPPQWAGRLDALAGELINLEKLLDAPHPDYWGLAQRLSQVEERTAQLIADVRGR